MAKNQNLGWFFMFPKEYRKAIRKSKLSQREYDLLLYLTEETLDWLENHERRGVFKYKSIYDIAKKMGTLRHDHIAICLKLLKDKDLVNWNKRTKTISIPDKYLPGKYTPNQGIVPKSGYTPNQGIPQNGDEIVPNLGHKLVPKLGHSTTCNSTPPMTSHDPKESYKENIKESTIASLAIVQASTGTKDPDKKDAAAAIEIFTEKTPFDKIPEKILHTWFEDYGVEYVKNTIMFICYRWGLSNKKPVDNPWFYIQKGLELKYIEEEENKKYLEEAQKSETKRLESLQTSRKNDSYKLQIKAYYKKHLDKKILKKWDEIKKTLKANGMNKKTYDTWIPNMKLIHVNSFKKLIILIPSFHIRSYVLNYKKEIKKAVLSCGINCNDIYFLPEERE